MEAHHNEVEPQTVEAVIVQAADALSGSNAPSDSAPPGVPSPDGKLLVISDLPSSRGRGCLGCW